MSIKTEIEQINTEVFNQYKKQFASEVEAIALKEYKKFAIHITTHTGKLANIPSINTSSLTNPYCIERSKNPKSICSRCYSNTLQKLRKQLNNKLELNSKFLSENIIPYEKLPLINALYFRFQSFGDLINMTHLENLLNIARKNPKVNFALWTKRTDLIKKADSRVYLPNLILIYSNPMLDAPMREVPKRFEKVFQVFSKDYINAPSTYGHIHINCGARNCLECKKCYEFNGHRIINELVK